MFETANAMSGWIVLLGWLSRLNNKLLLLVIDSAHSALVSERKGAVQQAHSNFIVPNQ
jgi:hypothetical protein